jgi:hypothetical protein
VAQDMDQWRALVSTVMKLWVWSNFGKLVSSWVIGVISRRAWFHGISWLDLISADNTNGYIQIACAILVRREPRNEEDTRISVCFLLGASILPFSGYLTPSRLTPLQRPIAITELKEVEEGRRE